MIWAWQRAPAFTGPRPVSGVFLIGTILACCAVATGIVFAWPLAFMAPLAIWICLPSKASGVVRLSAILLAAFGASSLLPGAAGILISFAVLTYGLSACLLSQPGTAALTRRARIAVMASVMIILFWAALTLHPNIPSLSVGLQGFRKSVLAIVGVLIGACVPRLRVRSTELFIVGLLLLLMTASILIHLFLPGVAARVGGSQQADVYTAIYDGRARLQGVFPGPFHAAACGLALLGWSLPRMSSHRFLAASAAIVGSLGIYLTLVRTAYVAVALILLAFLATSATVGRRLRTAYLFVMASIVVIVAISSRGLAGDGPLSSLSSISTDSRFLNRFPGYVEALELIPRSPIFGWGAGSAGDVLDTYFVTGIHVTSHNILLKFAVEGGLVGLGLFLTVITMLVKELWSAEPQKRSALLVLVSLLGLGLTGSAIETVPVSFFVLMLAGLALDRQGPETEGTPPRPVTRTLRTQPDAKTAVANAFRDRY